MLDLISRVSAAAGIEPEVAEKAIGAILAFLRKEGPKADIDELFATVPGAAAAATAAEQTGAGMLGGLMGMMGGGLMGLAGRLAGLGLDMTRMQAVGHELFAYVREKAGDERVRRVAAAIPGLSQFL
jgi:predicted lipid-binding transport protein (Tim44 family)